MRLAPGQDADDVSPTWPKCVDGESEIGFASYAVHGFDDSVLRDLPDLLESGSVIGVADDVIRTVTLDDIE